MSDALLIAAHGSRDPAGLAEFAELARAWARLRPDRPQASGFLEFARPTIGEAADQLIAGGASRIVMVPAMLFAAGHVKNDLPSELHEAQARHPQVEFRMARSLDVHPALLELGQGRYREALAGLPAVEPERTMLLLVGRGTSDPDANADVARIARFLWEATGVAWAALAYSGMARPGLDEALTACRRLGYQRIVVVPYLLFDGVLVKRVRALAARHAAEDRATEIVTAGHLGPDPLVLRAFEDRAHEALYGEPAMNCGLCKYRVRLAGREADLGSPQTGHHHHVRGADGLDDGSDARDHDHDHQARWHRRRPRPEPIARTAEPPIHPWDERLLRRLQLLG
jgi:sirohydrochlorin ferrochelatase